MTGEAYKRLPADQLIDKADGVGRNVVEEMAETGGLTSYVRTISGVQALMDNCHREFDRVEVSMPDCNEQDEEKRWKVKLWRGSLVATGFGMAWGLAMTDAIASMVTAEAATNKN